MNNISKRAICIVISTSIMLSPVITSHNCVYAAPKSISKYIGNWIGKKVKQQQKEVRKIQNEKYKEYKKEQAEETTKLLKGKLPGMTKEQVMGLKKTLDDLIGEKGKIFEDLKKQKSSLVGRVKNKKLIYEDHKVIRKYLEDIPTKEKKRDKKVEKITVQQVDYYEYPYSDAYDINEKYIFTPIPIVDVPIINVNLTPTLVPTL